MSAPAEVQVRRVRAEDWPHTKALRLEALADYPLGFLETLESARALDDAAWQERAARGAEGGTAFQVLGWQGGRPVAACVSFLRDGRAWLAAVYVTPAARGRGLLRTLVDRCADWARAQGAPELVLHVHEQNLRARAAYRTLGFVDTGATTPYPLEAGGEELEMARPL